MPRVKGGTVTRQRRKKIIKLAKGYYGSKHILYKTAHEQVMKSWTYSYRDRKKRKSNFRKLWIARINAAARLNGLSYSRLINGLKQAGVEVNRKMLADIAVNDATGFQGICETAQQGLKGVITPQEAPQAAEKPAKKAGFSKEDLEDKTVDELKELCKEQGITGYSSMKKAEIIDELLK